MQLGSVCLPKRDQSGLNTFVKEIGFLTDCWMDRNISIAVRELPTYGIMYGTIIIIIISIIIIIIRHLCQTCVKIKK